MFRYLGSSDASNVPDIQVVAAREKYLQQASSRNHLDTVLAGMSAKDNFNGATTSSDASDI